MDFKKIAIYIFLFVFSLTVRLWDLNSLTGVGPQPLALRVHSPNQWVAREFPQNYYIKKCEVFHFSCSFQVIFYSRIFMNVLI